LILVIITVMEKVNVNSNDLDLRITRQRQVILDELKRADSHLTADEIFERVRRIIPRVSLGTVYRNLEILYSRGLINKLETTGHQKLFEANTNDHHHMHCEKCGKILDIPAKSVNFDIKSVKAGKEFEVTGYRLELLGICAQCKEDAGRVQDMKKISVKQ
jgi:Fur family ferric uptake transcriptional regulator